MRPEIVTSTPESTQVPDEGGKAEMTCTVSGNPQPTLSWRRQFGSERLKPDDPRVLEIASQGETIVLKVAVSTIGEKYYCRAVNMLGKDEQEYTIRRKGT